MTRSALLLVATAIASALLVGPAGGSARAARPPAICPRLDAAFLLEFGAWGGPGTPLQTRELYAAAVTRGSGEEGGHRIYGSATPTRATIHQSCGPARLAPRPIDRRLSGRYTYRLQGHSGYFRSPSGETVFLKPAQRTTTDPQVTRGALAATFKCAVPGRVTVAMTNSRGGTYFTVRVGRELYATAAVRPNDDFTFRVSRRCRLQ